MRCVDLYQKKTQTTQTAPARMKTSLMPLGVAKCDATERTPSGERSRPEFTSPIFATHGPKRPTAIRVRDVCQGSIGRIMRTPLPRSPACNRNAMSEEDAVVTAVSNHRRHLPTLQLGDDLLVRPGSGADDDHVGRWHRHWRLIQSPVHQFEEKI